VRTPRRSSTGPSGWRGDRVCTSRVTDKLLPDKFRSFRSRRLWPNSDPGGSLCRLCILIRRRSSRTPPWADRVGSASRAPERCRNCERRCFSVPARICCRSSRCPYGTLFRKLPVSDPAVRASREAAGRSHQPCANCPNPRGNPRRWILHRAGTPAMARRPAVRLLSHIAGTMPLGRIVA
jgi:hypothetical protein